MDKTNIEKLLETMKILRSDKGCSWDRAQTHQTIRQNMLEEAYEAVDAIDDNDIKHLKEELGDVLLQVGLHSQIAAENNEFTFEDVEEEINKELITRNTTVFSDIKINGVNKIL